MHQRDGVTSNVRCWNVLAVTGEKRIHELVV